MTTKTLCSSALLGAALAMGCNGGGGDTGATGDTGTIDTGTIDTGDTDTGDTGVTQEITVEVLASDGTAFVGNTVVFHDSSGAVLDTGTTDSSGIASYSGFPADGLVTAEMTDSNGTELFATSGPVQPGDVVRMNPELIGFPSAGDVIVELDSLYTGATDYSLRTCVDSETTVSVTGSSTLAVPERCLAPDGEAHVLAVALDTNGDPVAWSLHTDVATGSTVTVDSWTDSGFQSTGLDLSDFPENTSDAGVFAWQSYEGVPLWATEDVASECGGDTSSGLQCSLDSLIGDLSEFGWHVTVDVSPSNGDASLLAFEQMDSVPGNLSVDVGSETFDRLHSPSVDGSDREVAWTAEGEYADADASLVILNWTEGGTDRGWVIQSDGTIDSPFDLPELPSSLESALPSDNSAFDDPVVTLSRDSRDAYAEYRQDVISSRFFSIQPWHVGNGGFEGAWTIGGSTL